MFALYQVPCDDLVSLKTIRPLIWELRTMGKIDQSLPLLSETLPSETGTSSRGREMKGEERAKFV